MSLYCDVTPPPPLQSELEELQNPREKVSLLQFITRPSLRRPFLISIVLHLSQQLSGIVGVSSM